MKVWPEATATLPPMPQVQLELGGQLSRLEVAGLHLSFEAKGDSVPAQVVSAEEGVSMRELVLSPTRKLKSGLRYALMVAPGKDELTRDLARRVHVSFLVGEKDDARAPTWSGTPTPGEATARQLGCGPEVFVQVTGVALDEPALVETSFDVDGHHVVHRLEPKDGVLAVGHGMCSGAFDVRPGQTLAVTLVPVDLAGNRGAAKQVTLKTPEAK